MKPARGCAQAMIDAATRGVKVHLIVDGLGSEQAEQHRFFEPLREAGVDVCRFVPRWGRRYLLRNHQKLALADEARAIIGGFNVRTAISARPPNRRWRDSGCSSKGRRRGISAGYFDSLARWAQAAQGAAAHAAPLAADLERAPGQDALAVRRPDAKAVALGARDQARPPKGARRSTSSPAISRPARACSTGSTGAGMRGQVRIVLPSKNDHGAAIWASRFTYAGLLRKRVEIYEYQPTKLHTKLFVVDDVVYIGSANYDIRSLFLNLEMMLRIEDTAFARHARSYVDGEIANSERDHRRASTRQRTNWWMRIKQAAAFFVMTVLDFNVTKRLNFGPARSCLGLAASAGIAERQSFQAQ